jgi:hypothetical protein
MSSHLLSISLFVIFIETYIPSKPERKTSFLLKFYLQTKNNYGIYYITISWYLHHIFHDPSKTDICVINICIIKIKPK